MLVLIQNQQTKGGSAGVDKVKWPDDIKFDVGQIAAMMKETLKELSEHTGIEYNHLRLLSSGDARMLGKDLIALHEYTGIPVQNIKV